MSWLVPDWPAPGRVGAVVTTRSGGVSAGPWRGFNLAVHVGDDPAAVAANRAELLAGSGLASVQWLEQVHGTGVVELPHVQTVPVADAAVTSDTGTACAVLTADCMPVLFCDRTGSRVGIAHAGWRGLADGVLEATLARFDCPADEILAWLGPAIGPAHFEVGQDVFDRFVQRPGGDKIRARLQAAFAPLPGNERYHADLYELARAILSQFGIHRVYGGGFCTYADARFYSYRRDDVTGRFASLIWLKPDPGDTAV